LNPDDPEIARGPIDRVVRKILVENPENPETFGPFTEKSRNCIPGRRFFDGKKKKRL